MERLASGRRFVALASILAFVLVAGACETSDSNGSHGGYKNGGGKGKNQCYERVLDIDKKTGQAHYVDRVVPCPK